MIEDAKALSLVTIGHSNQTMESFTELLHRHQIEVVVDVRSYPFSKYAHQFDHDRLTASLKLAGFKYLYLGRELGGMPRGEQFYDGEGGVLYDKIAATDEFQQALERVITGVQSYRVALMCGEEDPSRCHRRNLLGRELINRGLVVRHIRAGGMLFTDAELDADDKQEHKQLNLF